MQIENRACVRLLRPWQEALLIALDQTHSAVSQLGAMFSEIFTPLIEEPLQRRSWDVYLGDHFSRRIRSVELIVDLAMVVVRVDAQLVQVRPVHLTIGREVVVCVSAECLFLIGVGEIQELSPVLICQLLLCAWYWRVH